MQSVVVFMVGVCVVGCYAGQQTYAVKGRLICPSEPEAAAKARVKIYDEDVGVDDLIDEKDGINADGTFYLEGRQKDVWPGDDIDVKMKIYHDCMDNTPLRQREFKFALPDRYIDLKEKGKIVPFDFGVMNLEMVIDDDESTEADLG